MVGYHFVSAFFAKKSVADLQLVVDQSKYNEQDLISLKVPTRMPYMIESPQFESAEGVVKLNGVYYQYVKKRVYQGYLEILCLPNMERTTVQNKNADIAGQSFVGDANSKTHKNAKSSVKFVMDDIFCVEYPVAKATLLAQNIRVYSIFTHPAPSHFSYPQERPPQPVYS